MLCCISIRIFLEFRIWQRNVFENETETAKNIKARKRTPLPDVSANIGTKTHPTFQSQGRNLPGTIFVEIQMGIRVALGVIRQVTLESQKVVSQLII